jgi:hypothetical protein
MTCLHIYGFSGKNKVAVAMHGGVAAELVLPKNITEETKDAIRSSHIFSPAKLMIEKDSISWNNDIKAFECSIVSDATAIKAFECSVANDATAIKAFDCSMASDTTASF